TAAPGGRSEDAAAREPSTTTT
ncbi:MAG: hypothetical protein QOK49_4808, partial [Baekduia sp.]|nr:hypothetical protein [Baekduia sp.]